MACETIWLPLRSPTAEEQAAFDDIYDRSLQHELQHNAIDEAYFSLLNRSFVGNASSCNRATACAIAQVRMIAAHDANFQAVKADSSTAQSLFELSDTHNQFTTGMHDLIDEYARRFRGF